MDICSCFYHSHLFVCNEPIKAVVLKSVVFAQWGDRMLKYSRISVMTMYPFVKESGLLSSKSKEEWPY